MEHPAERTEAAPKKASPIVPTLLTLGNAMCGFAAVACLINGTGAGSDLTSAMIVAACLIYLAMIFDTFDGLAARVMNQSGPFGANLDSLSDAISFGVAPALLMAEFSARYGHSPYLIWPIAGVYVACAIMRLARFNVQNDATARSKHSFCGLPSPAAAGTVAAFPLLASATPAWGNVSLAAFTGRLGVWLDTIAQGMPFVAAVVAGLMVSRVRYAHIGRHLVAGRRSKWYPVRLAVALLTASLLPQATAAMLFGWYTFVTPFRSRPNN